MDRTHSPTAAALVLVLTVGDCFRSTSLPPTSEVSWSTVASAGNRYTCALDGSGTAWCCGANGEGQLGAGSTRFSYFGPIEVGDALSGS